MKRSTSVAFLLLCLLAKKAAASGRAKERTTITTWRSSRGGEISCRGCQTSCLSSSSTTSGKRGCFSFDDSESAGPTAKSALLALRGGGHSSSSDISGGGSSMTMTNAVAALSSFAKNSPIRAAFLSCAINGLAADWVAQRSEAAGRRSAARRREAVATATRNIRSGAAFVGGVPPSAELSSLPSASSEPHLPPATAAPSFEWDARRSLAFVLYGGCYQGVACHAFYNVLFLRWFGPGRVWTKVAASQFVLAPLLTLPCAYLFRGMVFGGAATRALEDYWTGVTRKGLLFSFWKLWIPVQFLIFAVVPVHWRIPFSSFFSFLWTVVLSRKTSHS